MPRRPPPRPPADAAEGAGRVHELLLTLFDRRDGTGADWRMMLESLYRAGFQMADKWPDRDASRSLMTRVHEGAERRMTDGYADGSGASNCLGAEAESTPSNTTGLKSPRPKPPR